MNKYLEKIAEKNDEKAYSTGAIVGSGLATHYAGKRGAELATQPSLSSLGDRIIDAGENTANTDPSSIRKFIRDDNLDIEFNIDRNRYLKSESGKINYIKNSVPYRKLGEDSNVRKLFDFAGKNEAYDRMKEKGYNLFPRLGKGGKDLLTISPGGKPDMISKKGKIPTDVVMHELGHAKDFKKGLALKHGADIVGKPLGLAGGAYLLSDEDTDQYAPAAAAAGEMPTLRTEFEANRHAYNAIKDYEGKNVARKALRKTLLPSYGIYLLEAVPGVAGMGAASYIADKMHENNEEQEKQSSVRNKYLEKIADKNIDVATPRPKSLSEIMDDGSSQSYRTSVRKNKGDAAADAVKEMQERASTPRSSKNVTKPRQAGITKRSSRYDLLDKTLTNAGSRKATNELKK